MPKLKDLETYNRKQLYDLVWSKPMSELAVYFGLSDRGLAKLCERNSIPTPPRGYWAKKAAGKKTRKPPFIMLDADNEKAVVLFKDPTRLEAKRVEKENKKEKSQDEYSKDVLAAIAKEKLPENEIKVPKTLSSPHKIIAAWIREEKEAIERAKRNPFIYTYTGLFNSLNSEEKQFERRRRRILSALLKALEYRGLEVKEEDGKFLVVMGKDSVLLSFYEYIQQKRRKLTEEDYNDKSRYIGPEQKWTVERIATGFLRFDIENEKGFCKLFRGTEDAEYIYEEHLNDAIIEIIKALWSEKVSRIRREEEEEKRRKKERLEAEKAAEIRKEEKKKEKLKENAVLWRQAVDIRAYVAEMQKASKAGLIEAREEEITLWTEWALNCADEIDPLKNGEVLQQKEEEESRSGRYSCYI